MADYFEIVQQFENFIYEHDMEPPPKLIADGRLRRFYNQGDKRGTLNGAYKLCIDGRPAGYLENFRTGAKFNWKFDGPIQDFTPEERRKFAEQQRQRKEQRDREELAKNLNTANRAQHIMANAKPVLNHPYLERKQVKAHGTKDYKGALVVPLFNASLRLMNLQFISADGTKRFLTGGQKKGCFWWIGGKTEKVLIAEGFATAASLHQATGHQCFIAFDAGNLPSVAAIVRAKRPDATIVICADNDTNGRGQQAAEEAALACDGLIAMPDIEGFDFNDLLNDVTPKDSSHDGQ